MKISNPDDLAMLEAAPTAEPSSAMPGGFSYGLTHEQELFRTKWGWAAFDQAQKALSEAP